MATKRKRGKLCCVCSKEGNKTSYEDYKVFKEKNYCEKHYEELMDKEVSCKVCKKKVKNRHVLINKYNFCSEQCLNKYDRTRKEKDDLSYYLVELFGVEDTKALGTGIFVQIENLIKKGLTYKGIELTLRYCTGELGKTIEKGNIGLVQYYYDQAKLDYIEKLTKAKELENIDFEKLRTPTYYTPQEDYVTNESRINKILIRPEDIMT